MKPLETATHDSRGVWSRFLSLLQPGTLPDDQFYLFGLLNDKGMPPVFRALLVMVWKFIIIALTDLGMHKTPFAPHTIWRSAVRRFVEKACACEWGAKLAIDRASGRGEPHTIGAKNKALTPLGGLDNEEGILSWRPDILSRPGWIGWSSAPLRARRTRRWTPRSRWRRT